MIMPNIASPKTRKKSPTAILQQMNDHRDQFARLEAELEAHKSDVIIGMKKSIADFRITAAELGFELNEITHADRDEELVPSPSPLEIIGKRRKAYRL
jgi:hypothetical protein